MNSSSFVLEPQPPVTVPTSNGRVFPIRRIFLIGRNYAEHVRELGGDPKADPPVFFTKPADAAIVPDETSPGVPFAPMTEDLHFEAELVLALKEGGTDLPVEGADALIWGMGLGCDLTRRDLQHAAKAAGTPWDMAKGIDHSAVLAPLVEGAVLDPSTELTLTRNGEICQRSALENMIWSPAEIISELSKFVQLQPGDLIFTGTPEGVGPLAIGDEVEITAGALPPLRFVMTIGNAAEKETKA